MLAPDLETITRKYSSKLRMNHNNRANYRKGKKNMTITNWIACDIAATD